MIIFYKKDTGDIIGTIDGRINTPEELNMSLGTPDEQKDIDRIIVTWKPIAFFDAKGRKVDPVKDRESVYAAEFVPDHPQKELFQKFDNRKLEVLKYKVSPKTKRLIPISPK